MSEEVFNMNFYGADELINALEKMAKEYPDAAGDLLRERGLELRRKIVLSAHENTNTKGDSKRSLGKIGSYRLSKVQGYGIRQFVELTVKSPHFHLVEQGHNMVNKKGETVGFVQGRHYFEKAVKEFEEEMPDSVEAMVDDLIGKAGLK